MKKKSVYDPLFQLGGKLRQHQIVSLHLSCAGAPKWPGIQRYCGPFLRNKCCVCLNVYNVDINRNTRISVELDVLTGSRQVHTVDSDLHDHRSVAGCRGRDQCGFQHAREIGNDLPFGKSIFLGRKFVFDGVICPRGDPSCPGFYDNAYLLDPKIASGELEG